MFIEEYTITGEKQSRHAKQLIAPTVNIEYSQIINSGVGIWGKRYLVLCATQRLLFTKVNDFYTTTYDRLYILKLSIDKIAYVSVDVWPQ